MLYIEIGEILVLVGLLLFLAWWTRYDG